MRLAIVGPSAPLRGGIAQHTDRLVTALRDDHEIDLYPFSRQYPGWLFPGRSQVDPDGGERLGMRMPFDPYRRRSWQAVSDDIVARSPDLVLVQWWHPWFAVAVRGLLARLRRAFGNADRLAVICHNVLPHKSVPMQRVLARSALKQAGRFVVHAQSEAARLRDLIGGDPIVHQTLLPCLAPEVPVPPRAEARASLAAGDAPLILFFGLVRGYKGLDDLLAALPRMRRTDARILVAGEFYDSRERIERTVRELGIADRVTLRDEFVPSADIPTLFAAADVVALPYRSATQSSVLPFAVHYDKRFVVTDVGGLVEATQGLTEAVPARDPGAMAVALDDAIEAGAVADSAEELESWRRAAVAFRPEGIRAAYQQIAASVATAVSDSVPARSVPDGADSKPAATVVVAAHDACPHLEGTVLALAEQDFTGELEILVVYDGDVARLRERLAGIAPSHLRVVAESALGLNRKRNRGIVEARADWLLFTDDDCVPDRNWVTAMTSALATQSVVTGAVLPFDGGVRASLRERPWPRRFAGWMDTLLPWRAGCGNNLAVRRSTVDSLGTFESRIGVGTWSGAACDTEFLFRVLRRRGGAIFYEPTAVVRHRQEPIGPAVLAKRRGYYRGISFMARRIHPGSPTAWLTAGVRLFGTAGACLWSGIRRNGESWRIHKAEFCGAVEGFFPPRTAVDLEDTTSLQSKEVAS